MIFITAKFQILPEHADRWPEISREFTEATRAEAAARGVVRVERLMAGSRHDHGGRRPHSQRPGGMVPGQRSTFISPSSFQPSCSTSVLTIRGVAARYGGRSSWAFLKWSDAT